MMSFLTERQRPDEVPPGSCNFLTWNPWRSDIGLLLNLIWYDKLTNGWLDGFIVTNANIWISSLRTCVYGAGNYLLFSQGWRMVQVIFFLHKKLGNNFLTALFQSYNSVSTKWRREILRQKFVKLEKVTVNPHSNRSENYKKSRPKKNEIFFWFSHKNKHLTFRNK